MILPVMQEDLNITTTQIGFISTSNFIGYFLGIIVSNYLYLKINTRNLLFYMLSLQAFFMYLMIFLNDHLSLAFSYALVGLFIAVSNISIIAFLVNSIPKKTKGKVLGFVVSGNGVAIILSGFLIPYSINTSWQYSWTVMSFIVFLIAIITLIFLKDKKNTIKNSKNIRIKSFFKSKTFWKIGSLYIVFGISYIMFLSYFVSALAEKYQFSKETIGFLWALLGLSSLFSGLIFGHIADKIGPYKTLSYIFLLQFISHMLLTLDISSKFLFLSAIGFGITVWSVPVLIALLCNQSFGDTKTTQAYALVTVIFSVAQIVAPLLGGFIFDNTNDFSYVFAISSIILFIGTILSFIYQKSHKIKTLI